MIVRNLFYQGVQYIHRQCRYQLVEGDDASASSISSGDEDEGEMDVEAREETPDLYRNSALGM